MNFQQSNDLDFKGGNTILMNGSKKRNNRLIDNKPKINLNKEDKNILLEIESQNKEYKKALIITPWGIEGSSKLINYEEGSSTNFGYDSFQNKVRKLYIYLFLL